MRFFLPLLLTAAWAASWTVCIDPGHGGSDAGALGIYCTEKAANLEVAYMSRSYLDQMEECTDIGMTRLGDQDVSLADRVSYANAGGYDRFISIHHNAFNGSVQGTETYCDTDGPPGSFALRDAVHPHLVSAFGYYDRGTKTAGYYVLRYTSMPAALGEASFIDYVTGWDESWRFSVSWMDHVGREGWAYCAGLSQDQSSQAPDYGSRVVDNQYPDFFTRGSGSWTASQSGDHYGEDHLLLEVQAEPDSAIWDPHIPFSGWFEVSLWWVAGTDRVTDAMVTVRHHLGEEVFLVDQTEGGGGWTSLGVFPFHEGTFGRVSLSSDGCSQGRTLVADAARFSDPSTGIGRDPGVRSPEGIRAVPNPSVSTVQIIPDGMSPGPSEILVYATDGRLVARLLPEDATGGFIWNASEAPPGVYLVVAPREEGVRTTSVVVLDD